MNWFEKNDIFTYELDGQLILYSPVARKYAVAAREHIDEFLSCGKYNEVFGPLADYVPVGKQRKVRNPEDYTLLTVLPNNVCNFNCSYCYSAAGRNQAVLDIERLTGGIDFFFDSKSADFNRPLTISYMGGGEPMLSWWLVKESIEYAEKKALAGGKRLNIRIITNGSVLNEDIVCFLKEKRVEVSVSFEILEEVQNAQRKHYSLVKENIRKLIDSGIPVQINSTITPSNVMRMTDMMDILIADFPEVRSAMFEPVTAQELFESAESMKAFYDEYRKGFIAARKIGESNDIDIISFAYLRTIFPIDRACPGEYCITAEGFITGCYCVATQQEPLFKHTCYGIIDENGVKFDRDKFDTLLSHNVHSKEKCATCKVKWNCGGGCFHQFNSYEEEYRNEVCNFTESFVEDLVKYKVEKLMKQYDMDMPICLSEQF